MRNKLLQLRYFITFSIQKVFFCTDDRKKTGANAQIVLHLFPALQPL